MNTDKAFWQVMDDVTFQLDFIHYTDTSDCLFLFSSLFPHTEAHVQYRSCLKPMYNTDLVWNPHMILSRGHLMYNINLRATTTTILSIRGATIPIDLVSSATDSIKWSIVLFKPATVQTSDLKSEFLCQLSLYCTEPADPLNPPCTPGISPTPSSPHIILIVIVQVL